MQVEILLLPHVRRAAAVALTGAALMAAATPALAAGDGGTGGTAAEAQSQPAPAPAPTAKPKAKKITVKQIQKALGIKADGVMGPKTRRAIKRFQRAHKLKADGVAGPATLAALGLTTTPKAGKLDAAPSTNPDEVAAILAKIAQCESGGNPAAVSPSGTYRGKYQFSQATWEGLGGTGDPAEAEENVQDLFAAALYQQRGLAPWPACAAKIQASR